MKVEWTDPEEDRRENAYKVVLIVSLCVSVLSCTCMCTVFPLLYQYVNLSGSQFGDILDFCEYTAESVLIDTSELLETHQRMPNWQQNQTRFERQVSPERCNCEAPPQGVPGLPGRRGMKGISGRHGMSGLPARLPCEPLQDFKKYCPEKCPAGLQGVIGPRGEAGDKGLIGERGAPGKDGLNGKVGNRGQPGTAGVNGKSGWRRRRFWHRRYSNTVCYWLARPNRRETCCSNRDAGDIGGQGPQGIQGENGPVGPRGKKGLSGLPGVPGQRGLTGPIGMIGEIGKSGAPGVCPTYCANDGGVFFVDPPPEWFKDKK
ncbi:hypothetical protein M3Y97_00361000 [Aphelenchoides bicaudatus]|nr:hypothetical protein M3Y97_00361000 [Aphelenchoides bicaudatus]